VGSQSAVLGFVGAPWTLASYIVEGGSSKSYTHIKRLAFGQPAVLHALLSKLADNIADYVRYQARLFGLSMSRCTDLSSVAFAPRNGSSTSTDQGLTAWQRGDGLHARYRPLSKY
jgi:hypothetical protein